MSFTLDKRGAKKEIVIDKKDDGWLYILRETKGKVVTMQEVVSSLPPSEGLDKLPDIFPDHFQVPKMIALPKKEFVLFNDQKDVLKQSIG